MAKAFCPKLAEMSDVFGFRLAIRVEAYLNATWIADPAVQKAHALQHRADVLKFPIESAVNHFLAGVPMRKITVKAQLGKLPDELDGAPLILENGRPMSFSA